MAYVEGEVSGLGSNGTNFVYPYPPMYGYGYGNNGGFFGNGDGIWAILLFAMIFGNGAWGNGFGGFGGGNNFLYDVNANTNRGFDNLALNSGIDNLQTAVTNGFANAEVARCNSTTNLLQAINGVNSNFQNCCCENRLATQDLKATVISENCADREALSNGIRDIISANNAGVQSILNKLCDQELYAERRENDSLRTQLNMQNLAASQTAQTAQLIADNNAQTRDLINRIAPYPQPSFIVGNPYTSYGYGNGFGCGCGSIQ